MPHNTSSTEFPSRGTPPGFSPRARVPHPPPSKVSKGANGTSLQDLTSSGMRSTHYLEQYRTAMDRQRQAFEAERGLWKIERDELNRKIRLLEESLHRLQGLPSSQTSSPPGNSESSQSSAMWNLRSANDSRQSSVSSTGDEVWRGSNPDQKPTRTFSEASSDLQKYQEGLPSIAEDAKQNRKVSIKPHTEIIQKPRVPGGEIDRNLDGITFKTSSLAPSIIKSVMSSGSPSPLHSPSPSRVSPGTITIPTAQESQKDPYTMHAGHTPLARHAQPLSLDGAASGRSSDTETPTGPAPEQQTDESIEREIRPPSERHDSYFPPAPDAEPTIDEDTALKGPLGLTNEATDDKIFLDELNTKLLEAAQSSENLEETPSESNAPEHAEGNDAAINGGMEAQGSFEQPEREEEPKLRIKRSMNFGSQLGGTGFGRAF